MSLKFLLAFLSIYLLTLPFALSADTPQKNLFATRITAPPKIDGILDEEIWLKTRCSAMNFVQRSPNPGGEPSVPTEVKVLYDNHSIYIGAYLYDVSADSIMREFTKRDDFGFSDVFSVYFDTYDDDINAFEFSISAAGVQIDRRWTAMGRDESWNAAWISEVTIDGSNWYVEMEVPFSALRFPKTPVQEWGVNFRRAVRRNNESNYWNEIDPQVNGFVNQFGRMAGVINVKSPVRLSISPYVSAYHDTYSGDLENPASTSSQFNGGMDIRYGINDAFTLDMILVPDFGQVVSDNQVLNLTPFEVQFDENRQFFKEGTDLFNKGDFFYSRRVGGRPLLYGDVDDQLSDTEEILSNPQESGLINATKLSGRTTKGFGMGVFNAMTSSTFARVQDTETGEVREVLTDPFTNYNVLAFDQSLPNNSYVSLVNTNVLRQGHHYDANLTGTTFRLANQGNQYAISGRGAVSQKYGLADGNEYGFMSSATLAKVGGNFRASFTNYIESDTYDPNDMGFLRANNEVRTSANVGYNIYKPFWKLLNLSTDLDFRYQRLYAPSVFTQFNVSASARGTFRNFLSMSLRYESAPVHRYDYFEPRVEGRYVVEPAYHNFGVSMRTDNRNQLSLGGYVGYTDFDFEDQEGLYLSFDPRFRVNNKLTFSSSLVYQARANDIGFAEKEKIDDAHLITFGRRDINTISNIFRTKYTFNNRMDLSFRMRHYWSEADYQEFYTLGDQGELLDSDYDGNENRNYNTFNIDMVYTYAFAPASEISVVWKNNIVRDEDVLQNDYITNLENTFASPQSNSVSVRVLYFIDYSMMMKRIGRNNL
ncbi:DUF5916 domain-containing protein [Tunicatimonas pelagia]|uniref:DUF5916 domain-containing protein n=1 Tax=Tunicatimonas pelagia TaxID=931531 RepID=UPI0026653907|nr:DUF5916 domain-containing protein [Tunicatimonas pelagia]WKN42682.1 DUF5916 domain-containing protein [Tunicatimonas pelagia]